MAMVSGGGGGGAGGNTLAGFFFQRGVGGIYSQYWVEGRLKLRWVLPAYCTWAAMSTQLQDCMHGQRKYV